MEWAAAWVATSMARNRIPVRAVWVVTSMVRNRIPLRKEKKGNSDRRDAAVGAAANQ